MLCMAHDVTAKELKEHLLQEHGILIRDCQNFYGLSNQFFRITTQLPEENDALVQAVRQFMENCQNS
jgi:threonine-phosphate decarboxylase